MMLMQGLKRCVAEMDKQHAKRSPFAIVDCSRIHQESANKREQGVLQWVQ
jgi:hypothetical protein